MERPAVKTAIVRVIWEDNFLKETEFIKRVLPLHNYVAVSTLLIPIQAAPGAASSSSAAASSSSSSANATSAAAAAPPTLDETYAYFREQIHALRLTQVGVTFSDERGNLPKDPETGASYIWEFNLKVAKSVEEMDESVRQQLMEKGVDVDFHMKNAIDPDVFCLGLWNTDTLMTERIRWIVFHGIPIFCPLLNMIRAEKLPERRQDFFDVVNLYFPHFYEVRQLMGACGVSGKLEEVAGTMGIAVMEAGPFNMAGPDSLLTLQVFLGLRNRHFPQGPPEDRANLMYSIS